MKRVFAKLPPWTLTIVVLAMILYLTLVPRPLPDTDIELFAGADKVVHGIMFGALAGALGIDVARRRGAVAVTWLFVVLSWLAVSAVGGLIELAQGAMAMGRGCEFWDFVADVAGAALGTIVIKLGIRK